MTQNTYPQLGFLQNYLVSSVKLSPLPFLSREIIHAFINFKIGSSFKAIAEKLKF
jgi:hypothetical protein